ncbi:MAG TPA: ATP-binding protein [Anaeromyxobacteraceae bacterium]|nr:ATP-binding protein [Anaeromyxobacteraceae bacterium]
MANWSGTARRLLLGFGAMVIIFGVASWISLAGLQQTQAAVERMKLAEEDVRVALQLASAVRDQYAHQAHTIIIGDESHLGFYAEAQRRVLALAAELRRKDASPEARATVAEIEEASGELDRIFRNSIVPAVVRGDRAFVQQEHARAQQVVERIQGLAETLVDASEGSIAAARAEVESVERRTKSWIVALLLGAPLLAGAVSLAIGRSIARPLARLQAGAARLAAGRLDTRIDVQSPDEFGALARQFNAMTASIEEHQHRLVQSEKLAGIGRLAAGVAHEINNPLAVILGYVRLMRKKADGQLAEELRIIEEEAVRARDIVEGLLDLSRPLPDPHPRVDLRELCDEVAARVGSASPGRPAAIEVAGHGEIPGVPAKLRQVLVNLVRNAAEAAGPGGRVWVRVTGEAGAVRVDVEDDGPGIGEAAASRLFEPFFTTKDRGTGLGLAVSRAIARAHGGDVTGETREPGGARFTLRLPRPGGEVP